MVIIREGGSRRHDFDFYPTPVNLCERGLQHLVDFDPIYANVLDPGAGTGVWGDAYRNLYGDSGVLTGVEIRDVVPNSNYDGGWIHRDYLTLEQDGHEQFFDLVMGNPPYKYAQKFIELAHAMLKPEGQLVFLLRLSFLEGQKRAKNFWPFYRPRKILVLDGRPSFSGDGGTDEAAYGLFYWKRNYIGNTELDWLRWKGE